MPGIGRGHEAVLETWETLLDSLTNFARPDSVDASSKGGKWDDSNIDDFKRKVNWRDE
jgi:hypothetical protein